MQEDAGDQKPWLLSALDVYALTFCSLSVVATQGKSSTVPSFLVAVPNHKHSESVDVYEMPSCQRIHAEICPTNDTKTGMVMTTCLSAAEASLCLVTGYDSGHVAVYTFTASGWVMDYIDQTHRAPGKNNFFFIFSLSSSTLNSMCLANFCVFCRGGCKSSSSSASRARFGTNGYKLGS